MTTSKRREEIRRIREEGWQAAFARRHIQTNPYRFMDRGHWTAGWLEDNAERQRRDADNPEADAEPYARLTPNSYRQVSDS
jgi:ribosome modulation factor